MGADATPPHVRFALHHPAAVLERRPTVVRPGHLEDAGGATDALHPEALAELTAGTQIGDKLADRRQNAACWVGVSRSKSKRNRAGHA
ncbi:MAG: hypothetical protein ACR2G7_10485 [Acidimicrobiales bacterium]